MRALVSRRAIIRYLLPLAAVLAGAALWAGRTATPGAPPGQTFDAAAWAAADQRPPWDRSTWRGTVRQRMVNDLLHRVLPGKTRTEVHTLLGGPVYTDDYELNDESDMDYTLTILELSYDGQGRMVGGHLRRVRYIE